MGERTVRIRMEIDGAPVTEAFLTYELPVGTGEETSFFSEPSPQTVGIDGIDGNRIASGLNFVFEGLGLTASVKACFQNNECSQPQIRFLDQTAPSVEWVSMGLPEVHYGDEIPVTVAFSEPIYTDDIAFQINGQTRYPLEAKDTISESVSFLYTVDDTYVSCDKAQPFAIDIAIEGVKDLSGHTASFSDCSASTDIVDFSAATAKQIFSYCATPSVTLTQAASSCAEVSISVPIKQDLDLSNWLNENMDGSNTSSVLKAKAITDTGTVDIPLSVQTSGLYVTELTGSFTAPENSTVENINCALEFYIDTGTGFELAYGLTAVYTVPPLLLVDEDSDLTLDYPIWPVGNKIFANTGTSLKLGYTLHVEATWQGSDYFKWTSSNESIATIDSSGNIILTGTPGEVRFTLTVTNPLSSDVMTFDSLPLTIVEANGAYLYVPDTLKNLDIMKGNAATVSYSSNICQRNDAYGGAGTKTNFIFSLYTADYDGETLQKGEELSEETLSATELDSITAYTIASDMLQTTTPEGVYGYILEIDALDMESGITLNTEANIRVRERPARSVLIQPETVYLTDSSNSLDVGFNIENKTAGTEYQLTVTKNNETTPILSDNDAADIGKTQTITIDKVIGSRLLDVYTVYLKAKNVSDEAWSYDSYSIYVYNTDAFNILFNNASFSGNSSATLKSKFYDGEVISDTSSVRYRSEQDLIKTISLEGTQYKWSSVADKVTWSVKGDSVSLWYTSDGVSRQIGDGEESIQLPGVAISLSGEKTGNSTITATHTLTNASTVLNIFVEPVGLYLFQVYPAETSTMVYTNGNGQKKTVSIGSTGQVGVYEESGIASDVVVYPHNKFYDTYTLSQSTLAATQNSSEFFDVYPVNTIQLSEVNYDVSLALLDGSTPYAKDIVVRGGVYFNGTYQPLATINGKRGDADQTVSIGPDTNEYTLAVDPFEFTDRLENSDELSYVFQVHFPDGDYPDQFFKGSAFAGTIRDYYKGDYRISRKIEKVNPNSIDNNVTVISKTLTIDGKEISGDGLYALEKAPENSATLEMSVKISNEYGKNYELYLKDSTGELHKCTGTAEVTQPYPFSDLLTLRLSCDIKSILSDFVNRGLQSGERSNLYPVIRSTDGTTQIELSNPVRFANINGIPNMRTINSTGSEYAKLGTHFFYGTTANISFNENVVVKEALEMLKTFSLHGVNMNLELTPTDDPLVYKGIIRFAAGNYSSQNPSGIYTKNGEEANYSFMPPTSDRALLDKGGFLEKAQKEAKATGSSRSYGGGAYMNCEVYYSVEEQKWKIRMLSADAYFGGGYVYKKTYNGKISFIPVTGTFQTDLSQEVGFTILNDSGTSAYIQRVLPHAGIYLFGGVGCDYPGATAKAGVYGDADHDQTYLWYEDSDGNSENGQKLAVAGSMGLSVTVKVLGYEFYDRKFPLVEASKSWTYHDYASINQKLTTGKLFSQSYFAGYDPLTPVPETASISVEDRSYLSDYTRAWKGSSTGIWRLFSLPSGSALTDIWTNAYPYAGPSLSEDGTLMTYLSDMGSEDVMDTAAVCSFKDPAGNYPEGTEISASDYPDSNLAVAGNADGASAVWVRDFTDVSGAGDSEATVENVVAALSASEVMAGIYKDGTFTATRLTDNDTPDIAPVTAASDGHAIAAWSSVALGDLDDPLDFTSDYIRYSIFNGSSWSTVKCLYDGSIDRVNTMKAAMLPDGTSAVVYQITEDSGDSEIICAVLDADGNVIRTLRLTDNTTADENPQITAVKFPDGAYRFVVGWGTEDDSDKNVLQLAAVNADGTLDPDFSLAFSDSKGRFSSTNFRFTKGAETIDNLSVVWHAAEDADSDGTYESAIYGVKVLESSDNLFSLSGAVKMLTTDEGRTVNSFDTRVDPHTGKLYFSFLVAESDGSSTMATSDYEYQNSMTLSDVDFSYKDVLPGISMPVQFTVTNDGIDPITNVNIQLGDETYTHDDEFIVSGATKSFAVFYQVPDPLTNVSYTVTAQFGSDGGTDLQTGVLKLDLPNVGIYQIDLTKETERERSVHVLLQNSSYADLESGTHTVKLEVSDSSTFDAGSIFKTLTFSGDDLTVLNDGLLSANVTLTADNLAGLLDEDGEIPDNGAYVFFRTVLQENGKDIEDSDISNDMKYVKIHSLIQTNGEKVSLSSLTTTTGGRTSVQVDAFNNSMNAITNGNIVVMLRDQNGNVLETKQTYDPTVSSGLLSIAGEDSGTAILQFDNAGYAADVVFARVSGESNRLSVLNMSGVPIEFDPDVSAYAVSTYNLSKTDFTAVAENPASTVSVTKNGNPVSALRSIPLTYGSNVFAVTVTTGGTAITYTVTIQNTNTNGDGSSSSSSSSSNGNSSSNDNSSAGLTIGGVNHKDLSIHLSGDHAVVSLGILAQEIFSGRSEATLAIPAVSGADGYTLEAPAQALAGAQTGAALTVSTELGSVRIPSGMLAGTSDFEGKVAGITITAADKTTLPDDIRAAVGDRPMISLTLTLDGAQTDWNNPNAMVKVSIPYKPTADELKDPESIVIWYVDGNGNAFCIPNGHYDPVTGMVTFTTTHFSDYAVVCRAVNFSDVASEAWYHNSVNFIAGRGITTGTGNGKFSPDATLTRGQFITLLLRTYGIDPDDNSADNFSDAGNTYYTGYLAAVKRLKISNGVGDNKFAPDQVVTRQEMFTLLYNALKIINQLPVGNSDKAFTDFTDSGSISAYAQEATKYLVENDIIRGRNGQLLPNATTTRAEIAQVLYNLLSN